MTSKMTINKYQGKTKEEAIEKAKQELGEGAVVMNVKEIKPTGMFKAWKSSVFEVTAAREEKENFVDPRQVADLTAKTVKTLNLAADENISPKEFLNDFYKDPKIAQDLYTLFPVRTSYKCAGTARKRRIREKTGKPF